MLTDSKQPSEAPSWLVSAEVTKGNQLPARLPRFLFFLFKFVAASPTS